MAMSVNARPLIVISPTIVDETRSLCMARSPLYSSSAQRWRRRRSHGVLDSLLAVRSGDGEDAQSDAEQEEPHAGHERNDQPDIQAGNLDPRRRRVQLRRADDGDGGGSRLVLETVGSQVLKD